MNRHVFLVAFFIGIAAAVTLAFQSSTTAAQGANGAQIAHGKYLVTQVAGCGDCHNASLHGGPLMFKPTGPLPPGMHWEPNAPNIVKLMKSGSADKWAKFLETGVDPRGGHPDPPMPQFRLNHTDAQAVVAYIRSLK